MCSVFEFNNRLESGVHYILIHARLRFFEALILMQANCNF